MARLNTHSNIDNFGSGGPRAEADIHDTKVNKKAYVKASLAARQFAKRKGISPIKATKALSEATRTQVDYTYGLGSRGQGHVTRGLTGLAARLGSNDRSGRIVKNGNYWTDKGAMIETFGGYLANETVNRSNPYPVLRPKLPKGTLKGVKGLKNLK